MTQRFKLTSDIDQTAIPIREGSSQDTRCGLVFRRTLGGPGLLERNRVQAKYL